ncbi:RNA-directed DNA polymerase, partial [Enterococcus faecium]
GFKRGYSIVTNASMHKKRRLVLNVDLEDFFGAINFGRVRGFFITNKNFSLPPSVATVLAQIICYDNSIPQGSPCSPVV